MILTNNLRLPQPIAEAVAADDYSRGDADISVTGLISPPRKVALEREHADELEEDVSDRIFALMGQAVHNILGAAQDASGIHEARLFMAVAGWRISGQFDRLSLVDGGDGAAALQDYKVGSVWEVMHGVRAEREQQLNCYAALARSAGYRIDRIEGVFILRDWSKREATRQRREGYPSRQVVVMPLRLWPEAEALAFMAARVRLHQAAIASLPECTDEERWARPAKWAVYKGDNKRAARLLDSQGEAAEWATANLGVARVRFEHRPGENVRCQDYCVVSRFCAQWAALRPPEEAAEPDLGAALAESIRLVETEGALA